jgi:hypothetical protein
MGRCPARVGWSVGGRIVRIPGVVAMRYSVYVVTADLYAHMLAGKSPGKAATAARRLLAADPDRQIGPFPVALQD